MTVETERLAPGTCLMNFDAIAQRGARGLNGGGRDFQDGFDIHADGREAPGPQAVFKMYHRVVGVEVNDVDRNAHEHRMNAATGDDPKTLSAVKLGGGYANETAKASPV